MLISRHPLAELTASSAVAAMRTGELRAESYAQALLTEAAANRGLNAFISMDPDQVLTAARRADSLRNSGAELGPLHGLPIAVKDSVDTADWVTTNGTAALREHRPKTDAAVVTALRQAGAIVMGKTNLTEASFGWTSNNGTYGAVHNPYDTSHVPGGSSGGSAVAVAARIAPIAVGADTLGSIRIPAAFCGVVGFRPTLGRYSNDGVFGLTDGRLDQVGPLARTVEDVALFDAVVSGEDQPIEQVSLEGRRVGIPPFYLDGLEASVREATEHGFEVLRNAGVTLVEADIPEEVHAAFDVSAAIMLYEAKPSIERYLVTQGAPVTFDEVVEQMADGKREFFREVAMGEGRPPYKVYAEMLGRRKPLLDALSRHFADHRIEALAFPTAGAPSPVIGEEHEVVIDGELVSFFAAFGRNTALAPAAGLPALALPIGVAVSGLPMSMEFDALPGADRNLLALGRAAERAFRFRGPGRPWRSRTDGRTDLSAAL